jgi:hypothetical protein
LKVNFCIVKNPKAYKNKRETRDKMNQMKIETVLTAAVIILAVNANAQDSSKQSAFSISGYAEAYYSYDFNKPDNHTRSTFIYSHNRTNEVNLNLGFMKAAYNTSRLRSNLALGTGTYLNANLSAEPGVLRNIYEANIGIKISKHNNIWIDAGILPSHIGFESAIGKDCWNLTRSMLAENSPYFESGVKLSFISKNEKWFLSALLLNGWQRIQRVDGNNTPAFGTQITYKPNARIALNSSSFIGNDKPDSVRQIRYFHNLYGIFQLTDKFGVIVGFDGGMEQQSKHSKKMNVWYSPVVIIKLNTSSKTSIAARAEYYNDQKGVIIATNTPNGFKTWSFSANFDYYILPSAIWRVEARTFSSKDDIFLKSKGNAVSNNTFITTALAVSF